jgi:hypothetical protein
MDGRMKDTTRDEVINWCKINELDFTKPLFPPPEGWAWATEDQRLILTPIFTNTTDSDIGKEDVYPTP